MKTRWSALLLYAAMSAIAVTYALVSQSVQVRVDRWLELRQITGTVIYHQGQQSQPARSGMRLQSVGDGLSTGPQSTSVLALDTGVGFIQVAENTTLRVQELRSSPHGGNITRLEVSSGQVRLQLRQFTNPDSRLEIQTPAGISGVRGTEFGVSVQPDGKTGVATLSGAVATAAQGQSVNVDAGFQSLVIPGEPPTPAMPLQDSPYLNLRELRAVGAHQAKLVGQIDPLNLIIIGGVPYATEHGGHFDVTVPLLVDHFVEVNVITPLGTRNVYRLSVP
jgi:FecR protein